MNDDDGKFEQIELREKLAKFVGMSLLLISLAFGCVAVFSFFWRWIALLRTGQDGSPDDVFVFWLVVLFGSFFWMAVFMGLSLLLHNYVEKKELARAYENGRRAEMARYLVKKIICEKCDIELCEVSVSEESMQDGIHLYCTRCPSFAVLAEDFLASLKIQNFFFIRRHEIDQKLWCEIESGLPDCECGGRFRHNSKRRCFRCGEPVVTQDGARLFPSWWAHDELSPAQLSDLDVFNEKFQTYFQG